MLDTPIESLPLRQDKDKIKIIKKYLNIKKYKDILYFYPKNYIYTKKKISDLYKIYNKNKYFNNFNNITIKIKGIIKKLKFFNKKEKKILLAYFFDNTSSDYIFLIWFKKFFFVKNIINKNIIIIGKIKFINNRFQIIHPLIKKEIKKNNNYNIFKLYPEYSLKNKIKKYGIDNDFIIKIIKNIIKILKNKIKENLPLFIIKKFKILNKEESLNKIHFPSSIEDLQKSQYRLTFEKLFFYTLIYIIRKKKIYNNYPFKKIGYYFKNFYKNLLPFNLTESQKKVFKEIRIDLNKKLQMNRILQGDVGSGKTIIAVMSMLLALDNNFQSCLMVPTEILAVQHYFFFKKMLNKIGINIVLLTNKINYKKEILKKINNGIINIIIGTHSIINNSVKFKKLGLVIIDEQHRFGVIQKSKFWCKNKKPPHILTMSATLIPRSLHLSLYKKQTKLSILNDLPNNRKKINTIHFYEDKKIKVYKFVQKIIDLKKEQVYFIYPLVKNNNKKYENIENAYKNIFSFFNKKKYKIDILHGGMNYIEKKKNILKFLKGKIQILLSTTIVELGIDNNNASIIVIHNAEKFGLSQLHQLRGRVGRNNNKNYCFLLTKNNMSLKEKKRIKILCKNNDGLKISKKDLKIRGYGDLMGIKQSGFNNFLKKIKKIYLYKKILKDVKKSIFFIMKLNIIDSIKIDKKYKKKIIFSNIN